MPKVVSTCLFKGQLKCCKTLSCLKSLEQKQMNSFLDCLMYIHMILEKVFKNKGVCVQGNQLMMLFF